MRSVKNLPQDEDRRSVVLSGASGTIGKALRAECKARGIPTLQLVRGEQRETDQVRWDPGGRRPVLSPSVLENCRAAIHLGGASVGRHRWTSAYRRELAASRLESTRALSKILAELRQPPQCLLVASAIGFYGDRGDEALDESSPAGTGFLAELCQLWEAASQPAAEAGIRVVHLRFGVVLGHGGGALEQMLPVFRLGLGGRLGSGKQWISWISLADAAAAAWFALATPSLTGPINVTSPNPVTNAEFTRALAHQLHRPAILPAPAFALRLALGQMADEALLASQRVVPAKLQSAGFRFEHPTVNQALAAALG